MSIHADRYDPGPRIAKTGAINLGTKDLNASLGFFRDILGMELVAEQPGIAYLRGYQELHHHSLVLTEQAEALVNSFSFRVHRAEDVERFHDELLEQEIEVLEVPAGTELGRGTAVRFLMPWGGHPIELYHDMESTDTADPSLRSKLPTNSSKRRGLGVRRIDHFNVQTSPGNINQAEAWLSRALGFKRREYANIPDTTTLLASWMSVTSQMHDIAIVANMMEKTAQMHHVAFNLENFSDVLTAADILRDHDVAYGVGPGKHGIGQAMYLYVHDPGSDHRVELYSGGYQIFDPDWQAVEWKKDDMPEGMTWYGDPIQTTPGSRGRDTTGSASLRRS
ncbi:VOC family protein [Agromyces aerolatus]|uniref:VOC family protein n=1 Tax=Agromyces sp. LY-1074 TaxID=3074080 RepID=UPI00285E0E22|nr:MULTISPECIES: VOC family protein [unclassified Agromyces]MDR5699426.1 VOC family protein [Agromyces sp. LY-1074]MDR5705722.1 VOC family protein [Agromyces sp. LY-1358]